MLAVAVAVDPCFAVGFGVEDPAELDGGLAVVERHAVVDPFGAGDQLWPICSASFQGRPTFSCQGLGVLPLNQASTQPMKPLLPLARYYHVCQIESASDLWKYDVTAGRALCGLSQRMTDCESPML